MQDQQQAQTTDTDSGYAPIALAELLSKLAAHEEPPPSGRVCPTCDGVGHIPKADESGPYSSSRATVQEGQDE